VERIEKPPLKQHAYVVDTTEDASAAAESLFFLDYAQPNADDFKDKMALVAVKVIPRT